ncbi:porin [Aromatoleum toluclasticum]|uniref:DcaP family trimeric outer membrane transporter n=1 Tax=Aromatoleum toluclasticum TaxID=92003 RepID=UPI001D19843F|nr:DcaP family trimeric outer membrane transporter [Aromatoleum toluclasticum]MCC4113961.1 porin [Aromatoleum toluclasticum]
MNRSEIQHRVQLRKKVIFTALACFFASHLSSAHADTLAELRAQVQALQEKISALEVKQEKMQADVSPQKIVTAGSTKGSFKLPGSDTSIKLGGYVKLDAIYSSRSAGANSQADLVFVPGAIPLDGSETNEKGQTKLHARQTRFNLGTHTPTSWGDLTTFFELDFFGADGNEIVSNSNNARLRHALASLGSLSVGQTWSTFMDPASLPETLDFGGPVGEAFVRQGLVRWTEKLGSGAWSVALENPESFLTRRNADGSYVTLAPDDDRIPDIVGRLEHNGSWGRLAAAAMARNLRVDVASSAAAVEARDSKWGGALGIYGVVPTVGKDSFSFSLIGGNALGRYIGQGVFFDADVDEDGKIHLNRQWGTILSYRHFWTDGLRSTVALSAAGASNPSDAANANRKSQSAHLNLLWSPVPQATLGLEFIHGLLEKEDGRDGRLNRVQASAQYAF